MDIEKYDASMAETGRRQRTFIACLVSLVLGVALGVAGVAFLYQGHDDRIVREWSNRVDTMAADHVAELAVIKETNAAEIRSRDEEIERLEVQYAELEELYQLEQDQQHMSFQQLARLWYVLKDAPTNTPLTVDHLRFSLEQCERWNVNPDWMWSIYSVESRWNPSVINPTTGVRGLGQVMPSTGRSYWENILGHRAGSFSTEMLYDPYVNIEITTAYIGRLLDSTGSMSGALNQYSGGGGSSYYNDVLSHARSHGITLSENNVRYR